MNSHILFLFICSVFLFTSCKNTTDQTEDKTNMEEASGETAPSAQLLWKTDTIFTGSESALYYPENNTIFVSCGNTEATAKNGNGFIAIIHPDGSIENMEWSTGLNAPKGMAMMNHSLYVTDIDEMVQIDLSTGEIQNKVPVEGAEFLNDAATDGTYVYFSEMRKGEVYRLKDGEYELIAENVPDINGLESYNGVLYGLNKEGLIRFDNNGGYEILTDEVQGGDGLIILDDDTFIASRWAGEIYHIDGDQVNKIVDTTPEESNTADLGYIPDEGMIIVPTFLKNEVAAYRLDLGSGED